MQPLDDGCEVNPVPGGCLSCPLPLCRYDDEAGFRNWQSRGKRARDRAVIKARAEEGMKVEELTKQYRLVARTIFRVLERA